MPVNPAVNVKTVDVKKARDFVYQMGTLWERELFAYLFQRGRIERVWNALTVYKNTDCGWGNALEHDIRTPDSNPLMIEFLLTVVRDFDLPVGNILDGTPQWIEYNRNHDGSLNNPDSVKDYPHAAWWEQGGQTAPDSIVGNLTRLNLCTPALAESTRKWVEQNWTVEKVKATDWLFMAYHAHDYFMFVDDFPSVNDYRQAVIEVITRLAQEAPEDQYYQLFHYLSSPLAPLAQAIPRELIERNLDYLASMQQDDGGWNDQHGLPNWRPYVTILVLNALKNYGRLSQDNSLPQIRG